MNLTSQYFEAQFKGICMACGEEFRPGRVIAYSTKGVVTEDCAEKDQELPIQPSAARLEASLERAMYSDDDSSALLDSDRLPVPPRNSTLCDTCFLYHGPGQVECW